ncbi:MULTISPECIES: mechanosensitive ion channel family protein [Phenylobacterium]|uniref:Small-conductance mechanosensitive channel n=1 Tax=Phenylobacterium koreense TaxID=266125 RepID=A0ABV2EF99_9CAUL
MTDWIERLAPDWTPTWVISLGVLAIGVLVALTAHQAAVLIVRRAMARGDGFWRQLVTRTRRPTRLAALILGLGAAAPLADLSGEQLAMLGRVLTIGFIVLCGWTAMTALDITAMLHMRRFKVDVEDNLLARKHLTQTRILRRTASVLIVVLTIAFALMTFSGVRQYGVSLLASAGAAGIIAGLALQPFLTNLIAGIQIATTQPIRLDDAVIVEGEWGRVEEITSTYVVVKLWDWRRMVLPLTYFIQQPFQNWTRESASLIGTAMVYVDYSAPIEVLRNKLQEIAAASPLWDRNVVNLAVTDLTERTMQVRCLTSARNAGEAFDLRCEVREKMVAFLQAELPQALPRERFDLRTAEAPA